MSKARRRPESDRPVWIDRHTHPRVAFHLPAELLQALDAYLSQVRPRTNKSEVFRSALEEFLTKQGVWPPLE